LRLQYDEPLSNFAYNFNLRRYSELASQIGEEAKSLLTFHNMNSQVVFGRA